MRLSVSTISNANCYYIFIHQIGLSLHKSSRTGGACPHFWIGDGHNRPITIHPVDLYSCCLRFCNFHHSAATHTEVDLVRLVRLQLHIKFLLHYALDSTSITHRAVSDLTTASDKETEASESQVSAYERLCSRDGNIFVKLESYAAQFVLKKSSDTVPLKQ